ncbi:uncharacterized protein RCC_05940 [Ramularia collo-cygni]|uniref:Tyrosine specific protein phosphatases domain-containing protein n=1 Tax=Ramularia collo-cygni TaxID=112498 RepID=A0A2D3VH70_9PEZI|nr:uncharacterized protein RCC_05940 [Ramularia collo-cygni]CZT20083.1 uncharacterized protein RCC_05940 [Ramularia collo-cygni]
MDRDGPPGGPTISYPHRADIYTYRVPTPPRIVVPPPALNSDAIPDIHLSALLQTHHFLSGVNYNNLVSTNAPLEWTYERRREAQTVLPFLCLGPMTAAKDEAWLKKEGITMLLGVRQKHLTFQSRLMDSALALADRLGIERHTIELANNQDLIHSFSHNNQLINLHLARNYAATGNTSLGKVLVFCESGNERSAGVVAAYLMETHANVDHIKAMQLVQAQRFCVNFDDSMKRLLEGYWDILQARRSVADEATAAPPRPEFNRAKRGLERDDDGDELMGAEEMDDVARFGERKAFAPFRDNEI